MWKICAKMVPTIRQLLAENAVAILEQPPYSLDLAPYDFFIFPKLKGIIMGVLFEDVEDIKMSVRMEFKGIPEESIQRCIEV